MITNATFGERFGRLGNQLFQLGLLFAIRERHGHDFYLPRRGESLWECFDLDVSADGPECTHEFHEVHGSCNYDPGVFEQPDGTSYHGYFQSYRYLEQCRESLTRCLRFNVKHRGPSEALLFGYRRRYGRPRYRILSDGKRELSLRVGLEVLHSFIPANALAIRSRSKVRPPLQAWA